MENISKLTDHELYQQCRFWGAHIRKGVKMFGARLPEVERRQLYKKYGFYSIFEFAAKLAGMRRKTVIDIMRVARKLEDKPLLKAQMEKQGWGKLRVVATIATKENEKILAEKVKEMSKGTLVTFIQEMRKQNSDIVKKRTGSSGDQTEIWASYSENSDIPQNPKIVNFRAPLTPKTELRLKELQKKLSKERKGPIDFNEVLQTLLDHFETCGKKTPTKTQENGEKNLKNLKEEVKKAIEEEAKKELEQKPPSRYIPAKVRKILYQKHGGRCAYPGCTKLPEIYHHTRRFSLYPSHDPDFIVPLCKEHERLAHHGLIENEESSPREWHLKFEPDLTSKKFEIDQKVNTYRTAPV